jgi:hypothetical protein
MMRGLRYRQAAKDDDHAARLAALRAKLADSESRLGRHHAAIESGIADPADSTLKDRIAAVKSERDSAQVSLDRATAEVRPGAQITEAKIAAFTEIMRTNVLNGKAPVRRTYIRSVIDQVEVDDAEIRIKGRRSVLEWLVMARGEPPSGGSSFVREWRARRDSNSCPLD